MSTALDSYRVELIDNFSLSEWKGTIWILQCIHLRRIPYKFWRTAEIQFRTLIVLNFHKRIHNVTYSSDFDFSLFVFPGRSFCMDGKAKSIVLRPEMTDFWTTKHSHVAFLVIFFILWFDYPVLHVFTFANYCCSLQYHYWHKPTPMKRCSISTLAKLIHNYTK